MHREPEVPEAKVPVEECFDCPARITSKELAPIHSVKSGILRGACSTSPRVDADLEKSARMRIAKLKNSLAKGLKRMVTKVQWPCWRSMIRTIERGNPLFAVTRVTSATDLLGADHQMHDNWVAYLRIWSRRSLHRFYGRAQTHGNQSDVLNSQKPSYVTLTFETKIHRLEMICPGDPHQRNPNAPKLEDRSQEETEWQERCAREAAWKVAQKIFTLKEKHKTTFFSPPENRCLPASTLKLEEREFVVDSGASMHMISRNTLTTSRSPTTVAQGVGSPKARCQQAAADSQGSRTCMCANTLVGRGGTCREGRMNQHSAVVPSCRCGGNFQWDAKEEEPGCLVKTVNIQVKWAADQPGQDRRLPGVVTHSRL